MEKEILEKSNNIEKKSEKDGAPSATPTADQTDLPELKPGVPTVDGMVEVVDDPELKEAEEAAEETGKTSKEPLADELRPGTPTLDGSVEVNEYPSLRNQQWTYIQRRLFTMVSVGVIDDTLNKGYDIFSTLALVINLIATISLTFNEAVAACGTELLWIEKITVAFFGVDYVLRILTADLMYPEISTGRSIRKYMLSFSGIVDFMSFVPYYLPWFFPSGAAVFRMFRVIRIFRLFRINAYYDSLNVITEVLQNKKQQLLSSVFILSILIMASSLCMYSVENKAQPEVFQNAFSGIWWASSTLLTIGYGDIYPVTLLGKVMAIIISFLGVGMVAIPTGIISAGFVEQFQRLKRISEFGRKENFHFVEIELDKHDAWVGQKISAIGMPRNLLVIAVIRSNLTIVPRGALLLESGDKIVLGAEALKTDHVMDLKEVVIDGNSTWANKKIKDIHMSRQTFLVMVKRGRRRIIPYGDLVILNGDTVVMYTKKSDQKLFRDNKKKEPIEL